jgi:hypothetical protein
LLHRSFKNQRSIEKEKLKNICHFNFDIFKVKVLNYHTLTSTTLSKCFKVEVSPPPVTQLEK